MTLSAGARVHGGRAESVATRIAHTPRRGGRAPLNKILGSAVCEERLLAAAAAAVRTKERARWQRRRAAAAARTSWQSLPFFPPFKKSDEAAAEAKEIKRRGQSEREEGGREQREGAQRANTQHTETRGLCPHTQNKKT